MILSIKNSLIQSQEPLCCFYLLLTSHVNSVWLEFRAEMYFQTTFKPRIITPTMKTNTTSVQPFNAALVSSGLHVLHSAV